MDNGQSDGASFGSGCQSFGPQPAAPFSRSGIPGARPRLLDLFCCAGGAATGYHQAGFDVIGIDIDPQPRYPFLFVQSEAVEFLRSAVQRREPGGTFWHGEWFNGFDAVHASPPCQRHTDLARQNKRDYPCFIEPIRELLKLSGLPYVIENVEGAPLLNPTMLCGTMFPDTRVIRHRLFETNWPLVAPPHGKHPLVYTMDKRKAHYGKLDEWTSPVQVTGGGNCSKAAAADAMGMPWATKQELNEAIPPAYTRFIGRQLLDHLAERRVRGMTVPPIVWALSDGTTPDTACGQCGRATPMLVHGLGFDCCAQGIAAPTGGKTGTGLTVGKSPTPTGDAPNIGDPA